MRVQKLPSPPLRIPSPTMASSNTPSLSFPLLLLLFLLSLSYSPTLQQQQQPRPKTMLSFSASASPWLPSQNRLLVSPNATFSAGFRPLPAPRSSAHVFAVWFLNAADRAVVWHVDGDAASLAFSPSSGGLLLKDTSGRNIWPSSAGGGGGNASELVLGEEGNLVFGKWSSFDFPTDTVLPTQNISVNGKSLTLTSRRDSSSYRPGRFEFRDGRFLVFNSSDRYWSSDNPFLSLSADGTLRFANDNTLIASDAGNSSILRRLTLDPDGNLRLYSLSPSSLSWSVTWLATQDLCSIHGSCPLNSICVSSSASSAKCSCAPGFDPSADNATCNRKIPLRPDPGRSKFLQLDYVEFFSNSSQIDVAGDLNLAACESRCRREPRCLAFAVKFDGSRFCRLQVGRLANGAWSPGSELSTFLRVDSAESAESRFAAMQSAIETVCPVAIALPIPPNESNSDKRNLAIICALFAVELLAGFTAFWGFLRKFKKYRDMARTFGLEYLPAGGPKKFTYAELRAATGNFGAVVGQGGFGTVYKGVLPDGRVVAVKVLKEVSGGEAEFWAEVTIIGRMHHLNLVRMWGFCAEKGKRMLVYEYVPNGSLDKYLFRRGEEGYGRGGEGKRVLDWGVRYRIAVGVARAVAYLHEECLEWVLHCDLKPENILLEDDFCPKVSDFGLAKLASKKDKVSISRIRGTRGYLAPEWVKSDEPITAKADVYSFGMVLLEIVSGMRNNDFQQSSLDSDEWYFPGWAFEKVYAEKKVEEILDPQILDCYDNRTHFVLVNRMVKTAMWCLQDRPEMRPSMGKVAKMLEGTVEITEPGKPTIFYLKQSSLYVNASM